MNSMGMPGAVISRPVARRERLRPYHDLESEPSASAAIAGGRPLPCEDDVVVLEVLTDFQAAGKPGG